MKSMLLALALAASTCLLSAQDAKQGPEGQRPPPPPGGAGPHLLPRGAPEKLKLTADQQKQVADLEADMKTKLGKILTPDQMEQLKQMRPPQGQRGPGGQGGPGQGATQRPPPGN